jgi:photosystem II stability/assembly factor-like uncharacterized protein
MIRKASAIGIVLMLSACNLPFGAAPGPEAEATAVPAEPAEPNEVSQAGPQATSEVGEPIAEPLGAAIVHFEPGQQFLVTNIQMVNQNLGWSIGGLEGASDHVLRTGDGGSTWLDVTPPEPAPAVEGPGAAAVGYFLDSQVGWVTYYRASLEPSPGRLRVWSTQDGGENWTASQPVELEFLGTTDYPPALGFEDAESGWLLAANGPSGMHRYPVYLLRTVDGGRNWEIAIDPFTGGLQSCHKSGIVFADRLTGWATVAECPISAPELSMTSDGGRTWESVPLPPPEKRPTLFETELCEGHSPQLLSPTEGALAVSCSTGLLLNYFYRTEDGGKTWRSYLYPGGTLSLTGPRTALALGQKIYRTEDGGQTWEHIKTVQWNGQFSFVNDKVGWAVARTVDAIALVTTTDGGLIWDLLKPTVAP